MKKVVFNTAPNVLFAIPADMFVAANIHEDDLVSFAASDGAIYIKRIDEEIICTGECSQCPVDQQDCDNDCANCPCRERCEYSNHNNKREGMKNG